MSDERDGHDDTNRNVAGKADVSAGSGSGSGRGAGGSERSTETTPLTREEWEQLPSDPDSEADLGYAITEWEEFTTLDGSDQTMFLPSDRELLKDDAFIVAADDTVIDLGCRY